MENLYFDSTYLRHYFVCPRDLFCLNSLELLDYHEFLYRLLKNQGYNRIVFFDSEPQKKNVAAYAFSFDKLSYYSFYRSEKFRELVKDYNNQEQIQKFAETVFKKTASAHFDKFGKEKTASQADQKSEKSFDGYGKYYEPGISGNLSIVEYTSGLFSNFQNHVFDAIREEVQNCKTAIVFPIELFQTSETDNELRSQINVLLTGIMEAEKKDEHHGRNILVFTASDMEKMRKFIEIYNFLFNDLYRDANEFVNQLQQEHRLFVASPSPVDEVYNLICRQKYLTSNSDSPFSRELNALDSTMIYGMAKALVAHFSAGKDNQIFSFAQSINDHMMVRKINSILQNEKTLREIKEKSNKFEKGYAIRTHALLPTDIIRGGVKYRWINSGDLKSALHELDRLIGLKEVKERVTKIANRVQFEINRAGKEKANGPGHFVFTGNPGTGKTEVARLMGKVFNAIGVLSTDNVVYVKSADLISEHVGGSAIKTREVCESALDGVLLVDEAHRLVNLENTDEKFPDQFHAQAYNEIMTFMENNRDRICVIFTGYEDGMKRFVAADPGMAGRKLTTIHFPDYSAEELLAIYKLMASKEGYTMDKDHETAALAYFKEATKNKDEEFSNARVARNLLEKSIELLAQRTMVRPPESQEGYSVLTGEDIEKESSFSQEAVDGALQELKEMIGLNSVKEEITSIANQIKIYGADGGPGHFAFIGNPGTGKTVVAKLMGKIFKALGVLKTDKVIYAKKADLVAGYLGQSSIKTRNVCKSALDGVLVVDEAHKLTSQAGTETGAFDEEAYNEIMTFMENHRERICVIFTGYQEGMRRFLDADPGMEGRNLRVIKFPDYSAEELLKIYELMVSKKGFVISQSHREAALEYFKSVTSLNEQNFSNARVARSLLKTSLRKISNRLGDLDRPITEEEKYLLTDKDIDENTAPSLEEMEEALTELNEMIGLDSVKEKVKQIADYIQIYGADDGPGHYIFTGNPGTGKTVVAELMGKIFKGVGVLKTDNVVYCKKADLVSPYQGESAKKTREKCRLALDGVLVVDEAHQLVESNNSGQAFSSTGDKDAYNEIMTFMENNRKRICVIFTGYEEGMRRFVDADPGMAGRKLTTIHFPDYSAEELLAIYKLMAKKQSISMDEQHEAAALVYFKNAVRDKDESFSNARIARNLLEQSKQLLAQRLVKQETVTEEEKYLFTGQDFEQDYKPSQDDLKEATKELDEMIGLQSVKEEVHSIINYIKFADDIMGPGHYAFIGNPGTGKTVVAKLMGKIFKALGVLKTDKVIYAKKADLVAGYVGQSSIKTRNICKSALDGVLVVDEAHQLTSQAGTEVGAFDGEAYNEIMTFMENNRDRICVIFTGYKEEMHRFIEADPGMAGRNLRIIEFPDYSAEELLEIYKLMAKKENFSIDDDHLSLAQAYFKTAVQTKGRTFSNARVPRNLLGSSIQTLYNVLNKKYSDYENVSYELRHTLTKEAFPTNMPNSTKRASKGKTSALENCLFAKQKFDLFTPAVNKKYSDTFTASNQVEFRKELAPCIVRVSVGEGFGTAFFISEDGYLVTSDHVVADADEILIDFEGETQKIACKVVNFSKGAQMAVLKVCEPDRKYSFLKLGTRETQIPSGTECYIFGFSRGDEVLAVAPTYVVSNPTKPDNIHELYRMNDRGISGQSGGPIISKDGTVIGVFQGEIGTGRKDCSEGYGVFTPIKYFWEKFVEQNGEKNEK